MDVGVVKPVSVSGVAIPRHVYALSLHDALPTSLAAITARALTVSATADNKVYDGTTAAVAHLSDNRVAGDVFTDSYTSASFDTKDDDRSNTVTASDNVISGIDPGN